MHNIPTWTINNNTNHQHNTSTFTISTPNQHTWQQQRWWHWWASAIVRKLTWLRHLILSTKMVPYYYNLQKTYQRNHKTFILLSLLVFLINVINKLYEQEKQDWCHWRRHVARIMPSLGIVEQVLRFSTTFTTLCNQIARANNDKVTIMVYMQLREWQITTLFSVYIKQFTHRTVSLMQMGIARSEIQMYDSTCIFFSHDLLRNCDCVLLPIIHW